MGETKGLQKHNTSCTESTQFITEQAIEAQPKRQFLAEPIQKHNTSLRQKCATCVLQNLEPAEVKLVIDAWPDLPDAMKAGIVAMVRACKREP